MLDAREEPDERRREPRHQCQHRREAARDRLRPAERDTLRHQLAEDQREIGDDRHDDGEADRPGLRSKAERCKVSGKFVGEGRAAQRAGKDTDHGDADLHR